ncbi:hypothetical protein [Reichenbachiella sp. MALMAid0571]|uniref:hypothetical protein n=1 Tax=Reichenbachiella sp. MALMAid0571 TaxID=3143939 RepID=UPI0032DEA53B
MYLTKLIFPYFIRCCILISLFSSISFCGFAQVKTSVTFSNPWVNQAKQLNQDRKEYKKYVNDSLKQFKKLDKFYKHQFDSLARAYSLKAEQQTNISATDFIKLKKLKKLDGLYKSKQDSIKALWVNPDSIQNEIANQYQHKRDSINDEILVLSEKYGGFPLNNFGESQDNSFDSLLSQEYHFYSHQYLHNQADSIPNMSIDSLKYYTSARDSLLKDQLNDYLESYAYSIAGIDEMQMEQQRMVAEQERLDAYKADFNRYRDKKNLKSNLQKLSKSDLASKNKTLNSAHKTLSTYKKKYLTLPSSKNLEGGIKRTSLENKTFWERIKVGGNLRISQREYLDIDFAPSIAYLANTKWAIGTEFVFRGEFGNGKKWQNSFNSDTYGGRVFTDYSVYKSFFAHAEFENIYTSRTSQQTEIKTTQSVPGAMAGMGKTFGLGKNVNGKMIIQYNFIHDKSKQLYASPWVVRFGFDVKKLKKA